MKTGAVSSSDIAKFGGSMSARYLLLAKEHEPLFDELVNKLTLPELVELAKTLPFDEAAASAVTPAQTTSKSYFDQWLTSQAKKQDVRPGHRASVAVYCAAAATHALSKLLTEVLELSKQKQELLTRCKTLLGKAESSGLVILHKTLKGPKGTDDKLKETQE